MNDFDNYFAIAECIVKLLHPLIEIVIHDVQSDKILSIYGALSKRSIGDPSLLDKELQDIESIIYSKINFDSRLLKSVSIPIKKNKKIIALMCVNYDISLYKDINALTNILLDPQQLKKRPECLFKNDWQNNINEFIASYLKKEQRKFVDLTNKEKKQIVHSLFQSGAFSEKNATVYIAKIMNMSRATIFNYLREFKVNNNAL